jgi:hypothetical protein
MGWWQKKTGKREMGNILLEFRYVTFHPFDKHSLLLVPGPVIADL